MTAPDLCAMLREQLTIAGPAALSMLRSEKTSDSVVLVAALEAVSLLTSDTVGEEHQTLQAEILSACSTSPTLSWLIHEGLSLDRPETLPAEPLQQSNAFYRWLTLASLHPLLSDQEAEPVQRVLDDLQGQILAGPERFAALSPLAEQVIEELGLSEDHAAVALLEDLADASVAAAAPLPDVERAYAAAMERIRGAEVIAFPVARRLPAAPFKLTADTTDPLSMLAMPGPAWQERMLRDGLHLSWVEVQLEAGSMFFVQVQADTPGMLKGFTITSAESDAVKTVHREPESIIVLTPGLATIVGQDSQGHVRFELSFGSAKGAEE
jgi:hypothetical protein